MVSGGAIPPLVKALLSDNSELVEYSAAVLSALARTQGGSKKAVVDAHGIEPLVTLLSDGSIATQKHAASALWGLADGKEGVYDKQIVEAGAVQPLIQMLLLNQTELRGFAAACLLCCCADSNAKDAIVAAGGLDPLLALTSSPTAWLRNQATQMLTLLGIPFKEPEPSNLPSPRMIQSPGSGSPRVINRGGGSSGGSGGGAHSPRLEAQKVLPIREESSIDPEKTNPKVGELNKGDAVYVHKRVDEGGTWRALVGDSPGGKPMGWVTAQKDGVDFLVREGSIPAKASQTVKMRYHL